MNRDEMKLLFQYNDWANEKILDTAAKASPEQLRAANELGWGDLRGLLVHIMNPRSDGGIVSATRVALTGSSPRTSPMSPLLGLSTACFHMPVFASLSQSSRINVAKSVAKEHFRAC